MSRNALTDAAQPRHGFLHDVQGFGITPLQRAETLLWLQELSDFHDCGCDVFASGADLLDQLLGRTKVCRQPRPTRGSQQRR